MKPFRVHSGIAVPLMRVNIDTDAIAPMKEIMKIAKSGFGDALFSRWRYLGETRDENPEFVLNRIPYRNATIVLAGGNFGCGSSRENAVWALRDFGIRAILASSYGSIFYSNCMRNGVLPVILPDAAVESIARQVEASGGTAQPTVDLEHCIVTEPDGTPHGFTIGRLHREMLLDGLDAIDVTLKRSDEIATFQARDRTRRPWVYV